MDGDLDGMLVGQFETDGFMDGRDEGWLEG